MNAKYKSMEDTQMVKKRVKPYNQTYLPSLKGTQNLPIMEDQAELDYSPAINKKLRGFNGPSSSVNRDH